MSLIKILALAGKLQKIVEGREHNEFYQLNSITSEQYYINSSPF